MDPRVLNSELWSALGLAISHLIMVVGFVANGAMAFLLSHAVIPSLQQSGEVPLETSIFRRILYPVAAISALLALYSFGRGIYLAVNVVMVFYPRFAI
ncbi:MAG: hypothetical protein QOF51_1408 [Chloroflexota bacterium]|jgi:hypothetical protein|nr:hypothetical protein [Chloroflexota bacterium]